MTPIASKTPGMKEIVGILTTEGSITNCAGDVVLASHKGRVKFFIDRKWAEFMASFDLGPHWEALAAGPTLFSVDWVKNEIAPGVISWHTAQIEVEE